MSVELTDGELKSAKDFIENFTKTCNLVQSEIDNLPTKPVSRHCTREEVEAECLHVALEYLCDSGAPDVVSTTIARQVADEVSGLDLTSLQVELKKVKTDDEDEEGEGENKNDNVLYTAYDCEQLAIKTINTVRRICKEWKSKIPPLTKSRYSYEVYAHSEKNTRRRMEDKHIVLTQMNNLFGLDKNFPSQAYFGVFDGHGGIEAACYTVAHLHDNIAKQDAFSSDLDEALRQAFRKTDEMFLEKSKREGLRSGTTGVVVFLRDNTFHIGWLGDSQVTLCKRGMAIHLMEPHKPNRQDERKRIEELGGCVVWFGDWRVNGNIAVSRSLGDREHKPFVSGEPDTREFDLEGDEEYVILGCDGLWDTIAPPDVIKIVQEHLTKGGARSEVAKLLVQQAIEQGSTDNVTVVIVFLDSHRKEGSYTETKEPAEETNPVPDERDVKCEDTTRDSSASEAQTQVDSMVTNGVLSGTKVPSSISSADSQEKST